MRVRPALLLAGATLAGCGIAPTPRNYVERLEALALLQTLNSELLSHDSATLTLERWCGDHRLADPARIIARRVQAAVKPIPDELRDKLALGVGEQIRYRHVQLLCGKYILSDADNWYVPSRLTAEMNRLLEETDEPFGKVVRPLAFQRHTLSAELLFQPLPHGWEMPASNVATDPLRIPHDVLRHSAMLYTSAGVPFSAVVETYTSQLLDFQIAMGRRGN